MTFLTIETSFEVDLVILPPSISVIVMVKPFTNVLDGTTTQKAVAVSLVEPIFTPSVQFNLMLGVASSDMLTVGSSS